MKTDTRPASSAGSRPSSRPWLHALGDQQIGLVVDAGQALARRRSGTSRRRSPTPRAPAGPGRTGGPGTRCGPGSGRSSRSTSRASRSARSSARRWWRASGQPATGWPAAGVGLGHRHGRRAGARRPPPAGRAPASRSRAAIRADATWRWKPVLFGAYGAGQVHLGRRPGAAPGSHAGRATAPGGRAVMARSRRSPPRRRVVDSTATRPPDLPPGHDEDVARAAPAPGRPVTSAVIDGRWRAASSLGPQQAPVLLDVAPVARGRRPGLGQGRPGAFELGLEADHVAVGPVLGERQVEQVVGHVGRVAPDQVGRHVVGRPEAAGEGVGAGRRPARPPGRRARTATTAPRRSRRRRCPAGRPARSAGCTRPGSGTRGAPR